MQLEPDLKQTLSPFNLPLFIHSFIHSLSGSEFQTQMKHGVPLKDSPIEEDKKLDSFSGRKKA